MGQYDTPGSVTTGLLMGALICLLTLMICKVNPTKPIGLSIMISGSLFLILSLMGLIVIIASHRNKNHD